MSAAFEREDPVGGQLVYAPLLDWIEMTRARASVRAYTPAQPIPHQSIVMRPEIKERIDREIRENAGTIYMKGTEMFPRCGFSAATVETLRRAGAEGSIHSVDVLADPELRESIKEYSEWPTIPQVYIAGEFIGGCDITRELFEPASCKSLEKGSRTG